MIKKNGSQVHAVILPEDYTADFKSQWQSVADGLQRMLLELSDEGYRLAFRRYYFTDIANQCNPELGKLPKGVACVQQPPLDGCKCALLAIWTKGDSSSQVWVGDMAVEPADSHTMTAEFLRRVGDLATGQGGTIAGHCIRTWFFVRDIDENYHGLVRARNEFFACNGLTADTHFIASTGIEGRNAVPHSSVAFNALLDMSLKPGQMKYLYGASHFNRTSEYGVAFERGVAVDYPSERQVYISGTASIDNRGGIVAPGDIEGQTHRMLENIEVLLFEAGASWDDVMHMIVYLRDVADRRVVERIIAERVGDVPRLITLAPVCRPGWLVESECMAIVRR